MSDLDQDHRFLPLCTFCDAHHRNANQPGGCVIYWQGRTDAAEAQVERLLALVKELSEMGCEDEEFIGNDPRSHELHDEKNWKKCGECLSCRARSELEGKG